MIRLCCLALLLMLLAPPAGAAEFTGSAHGAAVAPAGLEAAVTTGGVLAALEAGDSFTLYGIAVTATAPARLYLAASADRLILAGLAGSAEVAGLEIGPGQLALAPVDGGPATRHQFDIARFLATARLDDASRAGLAAAAPAQQKALWWGRLTPIRANAQLLGPPALEAGRRDLLLEPALIRLRRAAGGDGQRLAALVAEDFLAGLAAGDGGAVAPLLAPSLFQADRLPAATWRRARAEAADAMAHGPLSAAMAGARLRSGTAEGGFDLADASGRAWHMSLARQDAMIFVTALEPAP